MADEPAFLSDRVGNSLPVSTEFPIASLRQFLLPSQLTYVKTFVAVTPEALEQALTLWVEQTQNIVVVPGPLTPLADGFSLVVSYVPAVVQAG